MTADTNYCSAYSKAAGSERDPLFLFCRCDLYGHIAVEKRRAVVRRLRELGVSHVEVSDLCGAAVLAPENIRSLVENYRLTIVACHPRAVRGLLQAVGVEAPGDMAESVDARELDVDSLTEALAPGQSGRRCPPAGLDDQRLRRDWVPWFPVIDRERCSNCGQCLEFCLFNVYERKDGRVCVSRPANCKTDCPACARVCPEAAIMFPKFGESPINGAEIEDPEAARSKIKVDMEKLFDGDVYQKLAERRKKAKEKSILTLETQKALEERDRCSAESGPEAEKT